MINPNWKQVKVPDSACPKCLELLNVVNNCDGFIPMPGDPTICVYCKSVLQFDNNMQLILCTKEAFKKLNSSTQMALKMMRQDLISLEAERKK